MKGHNNTWPIEKMSKPSFDLTLQVRDMFYFYFAVLSLHAEEIILTI